MDFDNEPRVQEAARRTNNPAYPFFKVLDFQFVVLMSKLLGGSKVDSAFHPSKVDKMSTRNFWELSGKK